MIKFDLPEGYNLNETKKMYEKMEGIIETYPEVKHIVSNLGSQGDIDKGTNLGLMNVKLVARDERSKSTQEVANTFIEDFAKIPNITFKVLVSSSMGGGDDGGAIQFNLMGQDSDVLNDIAQQFIEKGKTIPGLINFDSSLRIGKPEITLLPKREKLAQIGLTPYDLAMTLRSSVEGITATKYREYGMNTM